jgi:hypothetical protein
MFELWRCARHCDIWACTWWRSQEEHSSDGGVGYHHAEPTLSHTESTPGLVELMWSLLAMGGLDSCDVNYMHCMDIRYGICVYTVHAPCLYMSGYVKSSQKYNLPDPVRQTHLTPGGPSFCPPARNSEGEDGPGHSPASRRGWDERCFFR